MLSVKPLARVTKDSKIWALLLVLGVGAYLRLWNIQHLFKWIFDYDEGAYSLGGRFISQGYLPYRDFILVHPPLYDLALASIYEVFGYNFFYGRYLSVILFLACAFLAYLIIRKLCNPHAGLVAAALFAFFPGLSLSWYRVVQEPLGILLILLALWLATDYILHGEHANRLLLSGFFLGLALATKYTFAPAVIGFTIAILILAAEGHRFNLRSIFIVLCSRYLWLLISGILLGFLLVTGFFLATTPHDFLNQTILSQFGYRVGVSLQSIVRRLMAIRSGISMDSISMLCLFVPLIALAALFIRRKFSRVNRFLLVTLLVSLLLCASFKPFGEIRYFASTFIFALLAVASFLPALDIKSLSQKFTAKSTLKNVNIIAMSFVLLAFIGGTLAMMNDYNYMGPTKRTYEEEAYSETANYLEQVEAKKIYALNPIIPALYPQLTSIQEFDTFGFLQVIKKSPETIIYERSAEGVDYIIIDAFGWLLGIFHEDMAQMIQEIQKNSTLVKEIAPGELPILGVRIYTVQPP